MKRLSRLFRFTIPYIPHLIAAAVLLVIASLISLALPWVLRTLVDSVFVSRDSAALNQVGLGLIGLFILQSIFSFGQSLLMAYAAQRVISDLREALQAHLLLLPLPFFNQHRTGELVSRLTNDVAVIQSTLTETPVNLLRQVVTFIGGLVLMISLNARLTLLVLLIVPPLILLMMFFGRRLQKLAKVIQDRLADATTALEESLSGIRVVKTFTRELFEQNRYKDKIEATFQTTMQRVRIRAALIPMINFLGLGAITAVLWIGGQQVIAGENTPGDLIAFLLYALMITGPLGDFASLYSQVREAMGASERILDILATDPEPFNQPGLAVLQQPAGAVTFEHVSFHYEDSPAPVLEDINLEVQPAEIIALVGPSGVGKTTLVNLIPRFFDPSAGIIRVDGQDVCQLDLGSLRQCVGLVPQDTFLFGGTVRENILYGRLDASDADIQRAAEAAYASEFIDKMPEGYQTVVGERGVKLSAGQRQRISIARALLKDPRILILDEATSALDTESERYVQAALEKLMHGRTTFVIAHRLSTIQRADRILVLQNGRIVEQGKHADLLALSGLYAHLWALQFAEPD